MGGNMGHVVRRGHVVHRPSGLWTPLVQRFMHGLRDAGLTCVPRPLGLDAQGRDRRLAGFCDAYGGVSTRAVVSRAVRRLDDLVSCSRERVLAGDPASISTTEAGHVDLYVRDAEWLCQQYGVGR